MGLPYVCYLQKIASIFDFYHSFKSNFLGMIQAAEIWTLLNLFRMTTKVSTRLPVMCRFIRRSFRPLAEAIGEALSIDFNHFYPKLYKYVYS